MREAQRLRGLYPRPCTVSRADCSRRGREPLQSCGGVVAALYERAEVYGVLLRIRAPARCSGRPPANTRE